MKMWKKIALGATVAAVAVGGYVGYTDFEADRQIAHMERTIKADLNKMANEEGRGTSAKSIKCVNETRCIAQATDGESYVIRVTQGDDTFMWEVESGL